jgi:hypothetical protein
MTRANNAFSLLHIYINIYIQMYMHIYICIHTYIYTSSYNPSDTPPIYIQILTLANGDRIPMTPNVKIMFEVETLVNASPATVSRAGIIYVSDTDLDWSPTVEAWVKKQPPSQQTILRGLFSKYMGASNPTDPGIYIYMYIYIYIYVYIYKDICI